ncbi:hypothetical protein pdam_00008312 [Pocillopora damicornis]|uniref:Uncharacterized protein n=1 Tax=Pocillopora damicornis TaxID=46731 RepID=A0A3M6U5F0_POCDA|nr:hypothetical protein pdam_00008312 [Pocillopora damicornis]
MEQLVAIMAVCRLAILNRMPPTPLTLLVVHRVQEQYSSKILPVLMDHLSLQGTLSPLFLTERKRQWEVREALETMNHKLTFRLFEESELVREDSEAIRKFSDKCIVPEKLVAEYVEHLVHLKMRKEKKKEETERERMERLNQEYNDIDWVELYNSDKLSSFRVDELSLYFSHQKITFKGKKSEKVAMIKSHIGSLLYDSMECQQPRQPPLRNVQQQVTSSLSEVETDSQSDVVDRVVGSSPSSLSDES